MPAALERELDELFLEFSPVGLQGSSRLRETLALVDSSAYVDMAVPVASDKPVGSYIKRLIKKSVSWYMGFIVHQVIRFAWAVSRMSHVLVDRLEELEADIADIRVPEMPSWAIPKSDPGSQWWAVPVVGALGGVAGRVVHGECGNGSLVESLVAAGIDAYGVDPDETVIEDVVERGFDVRAATLVDHLELVEPGTVAGFVLTGSVQWMHPNARARLLDLVSSRAADDAVVALQSVAPEAWSSRVSPLTSDLAPGRPLHKETWVHLLAEHGFVASSEIDGGADRRLAPVGREHPEAATINAAIDAVNNALLGPAEYLIVARRAK